MTMINTIFKTAQSIEFNRTKLIAQSVSRNGRLLVASRNWVNPWRFVVTPRPIWSWTDYRSQIEPMINADRYTAQIVNIGEGGASWITQYQGQLPTEYITSNLIAYAAAGATVTIRALNATYSYISSQSSSFVLFKAGDIIQASGNLYPHAVTQDITKAMATEPTAGVLQWVVPIHRGWLGTSPVNAQLLIGPNCTFRLVATKIPTYRMIPPQRMEFTSDFEFMEQVL